MRRINTASVILLSVLLSLSSTMLAYACNKEQTEQYVTQILFGQGSGHEQDEETKLLLDALYICSEQSQNSGEKQLKNLKSGGVSWVPALSKVNVSTDALEDCSHKSWDYVSETSKSAQKSRKNVLRNTVYETFDFGWFDGVFSGGAEKCDNFSALLYYSHILCDYLGDEPEETEVAAGGQYVPAYSGSAYVTLNGGKPEFTTAQKRSAESSVSFSSLDGLGRAGTAYACIGYDALNYGEPKTKDRVSLSYHPSGWNQETYEGIVSSGEVYNRCHLIAHELIGDNSKENLITGTSYMNSNMREVEDATTLYIHETGNHVLYRVTPVYVGNNLMASGVQMEAYSVEDHGEEICYNRYYYNVQPGVDINYATGTNEKADNMTESKEALAFAKYNASEDDPDLMYEMDIVLNDLFSDTKKPGTFDTMKNQIKGIADDARNEVTNTQSKSNYLKMKQYQYQYMNALITYVPILLENEDFFNSTFK